jgi:hypothetical protein
MPMAELLGAAELSATAASIAAAQLPNGAIPWFDGGHVDPWDHIECLMALTVAGLRVEALRGYEYLRTTQRRDGSWPRSITNGVVDDAAAESNQCAYLAVGVWHFYTITGDDAFLLRMWPTVRRGIDFVVQLQTARGEFSWKRDADGTPDPGALLTGSSSIHTSLRYAVALSRLVGEERPDWELAAGLLAHTVAEHPEAFLDKDRFSMDWYYPVLGGVLRGAAGRRRIAERWAEFFVDGLGARCVSDRPWVTGAETCELALALDSLGESEQARDVLASMQHLRCADGSYWTGYVFDEDVVWPAEHSTWTAASVILAVDALTHRTPAAGVFRGDGLPAAIRLACESCDLESAQHT